LATQRLQKWLAAAGAGSRRQVDAWITAGRVTVDGRTAVPGEKVNGTETICVDGRRVRAPLAEPANTIIYHKPAGEVCSRSDPEGRATVFDQLPRLKSGRWISVGRLDLDTSGLLIFTTDGDLAHRLMHPSSGLEREYALRVLGELTPADLKRLRDGIELEDGMARVRSIKAGRGEGANRWYRMVLDEGRNRIVRRLIEACGCRVSRLMRVRFGTVLLPRDLRPGRNRALESAALDQMLAAARGSRRRA